MPKSADTSLELFEQQRDRLRGLAYRLTGSVAESDDVLQEAYLRWLGRPSNVVTPAAYLTRLVTRLCLDNMKSARARRESYVGTWLPEPVPEAMMLRPDTMTELANDVTFALLLAMERLTPLERVAFILHDVFDMDYADVAETLGRSEASCRQLASRGRNHVRSDDVRTRPPPAEEQRQILTAFFSAVRTGDETQLTELLAKDVVFHSDGGGRVKAATKAVRGAARVVRFVLGIAAKFPDTYGTSIESTVLNGMPGALLFREGQLARAITFEFWGNRIGTIYVVANPDKLKHLH